MILNKKENITASPSYRTLDEIRLRKAHLQTEIAKENAKIKGLWNNLFHKPVKKRTPSKRFSGLMNTSVGIVDGLLLGWKLYRKFNGKKSFF